MAQFDVYANPTAAGRDGFPYLVVLQSDPLDRLPVRLLRRPFSTRVVEQGSLRDALDAVISGV